MKVIVQEVEKTPTHAILSLKILCPVLLIDGLELKRCNYKTNFLK